MADTWWLIVSNHETALSDLYRLGDFEAPDMPDPDTVMACRQASGMPEGDPSNPDDPDGPWDAAMSPGEPHPAMLARSTIRDLP